MPHSPFLCHLPFFTAVNGMYMSPSQHILKHGVYTMKEGRITESATLEVTLYLFSIYRIRDGSTKMSFILTYRKTCPCQ